MAIYMKIDGIDGNATAKNYEKWIELESINFAVNRDISTRPGTVADRESTRPAVSELEISKLMDKTSPHIFTEACVGKAKSKVLIDVCQTGEDMSPYMQYTLSNVLFSNYGVNADKNKEKNSVNTPIETLSLNFDKIEMKYTPYDAQHNPQSPIPAGYDLNTAKKV